MAYTDAEVQASIQKATLTTIRRNVGSLGEAQIAQTFSDVQEAALGIFLLYQVAPFYVISLGVQRLLEDLTSQVTNILALEQALFNAGRRVLPVDNMSPLANANAALFELQSAVSARSSAFASLTATPAFQRFSSNVDTFLSQNGGAVKSNGDIVQTPQEAKQTILSLLPQVLAAQTDLQQKAAFLQNALADFSALNLPSVAAQGLVGRTGQTVAALVAQLTPMTPVDRLAQLRLGILDLLTSRAVLREIGDFKVPAPIFLVDGTASAFADATHPATPAVVKADIFAPYNIQGGPVLDVALDGAAPVAITVPDSLYASLSGGAFENFNFTDTTGASLLSSVSETYNIVASTNDTFLVYLTDINTHQAVQVIAGLTAGAARTAAQVAADINAGIGNFQLGLQYEAVAGGVGNHQVLIRSKVGVTGSIVRIQIYQCDSLITLGFTAGQSSSGTDSNLHFIVTVNSVPHPMDFTPGSTSAASAAAQIVAALGPNIKAVAQGPVSFQYVSVSYVGPSPFSAKLLFPTASNPAAGVLGLLTGATISARPTTARQVATAIGRLFTGLTAASEVVPVTGGANVLMRSEPSDPSMVVVYKSRGTGTATPGIGTNISLSDPTTNFVAAGVVIGDILVFRDGVNLNTKWTVTSVTTTTLTASGTIVPVGGGTTYEIGPNLSVSPGYVIQVTTGAQNGVYTIQTIGPTALAVPFEFEVDLTIPGSQTPLFVPLFFSGNVGQERLTVASKSTLQASAIALTGPAAALFFGAGSASAVGTTPWVLLPVAVQGLNTGDVLEDYQTVYNVPTSSYPIQSVSGTTLSIAPAAIPLTKTFHLASDSPVPFALLRSSAFTRYATLSSLLATWAALSQNQQPFVTEMNRLINIVLVESNPAPDQVNAAFTQVQSLLNVLAVAGSSLPSATLEFALVGYTIPSVDQVDSLVTTYLEKGSQRAIDLLLQGQFSTFFGLAVSDVSYAGAMLNQMRTVARTDMPVRKLDRKLSTTSAMQSSSTSIDFEYDSSNIDQTPPMDVPTELARVPNNQGDPTSS